MPYEIETKDGIVIRGIPDDVKPDSFQLKAKVQNARQARLAQRGASGGQLMESGIDPTEGMSEFDKFAAGAGKAITDAGRGMGQLVGAVSGDDIAASRAQDEPLMNTGAGLAGNIAGNIGMALAPGGLAKGAAVGARAMGAGDAAAGLSHGGNLLMAPKTIPQALAVGGGMGAVQPAVDMQERGQNAMLGAGATAVIPAAGRLLQAGKSAVEPLYAGGQNAIIGRALNRAAGDEAPAAAQRMALARQLVQGSEPTAAEVAQSPGIAAMQRAAGAIEPQQYGQRAIDQNFARAQAVRDIAGSESEIAAAKSLRESESSALRNAALENADYGTAKTGELNARIAGKNDAIVAALRDKGRFDTFAAEQGTLANKFTPVEGQPRFPGRYSENAQRIPEGVSAASDTATIEAQRKAERAFLGRELDSLKQAGYSPLNAKGITVGIDSVLNKPGIRASDVVQKTVGSVREKLASLTDEAGNLSAQDLYTVRKELGNTISTFAKESGNWDKKLTAGLQRDIQKAIDSSIERAGAGDLWGQYLAKYQELSKPINAMKLGAELSKKLEPALMRDSSVPTRQNAEAFAKALVNGDETAAQATGFGKSKMTDILSADQMGVLGGVRDDLARGAYAKDSGRGVGSDTIQKLSQTNMLEQAGIPTFLRNLSIPQIGGSLLSRGADAIYSPANQTMAKKLAEALLNPQAAARIMQNATPSQRAALAAELTRRIGGPAGMAAPAISNAQQQQ